MTVFRLRDDFGQEAARLGFPEFVSVVKGLTVLSLADGGDFFEVGLSEGLMLRVSVESSRGPTVDLISTLNEGEPAPTRLQIVSEDEQPTALLVEQRIRSLRQAYSILLMLFSGRQDELGALLVEQPDIDIEIECLSEGEQLELQAANAGSFSLTVLAGSLRSAAAVMSLNALSLIFSEGRSMLRERIRATSELKRQEAARAYDQRVIELAKALNEVTEPMAKEAIKQRLFATLQEINSGVAGPIIDGLVEGPPPPTLR